MVQVKHVMDRVEPTDGVRFWVEPVRLARNLAEWCAAEEMDRSLRPPRDVWEWFQDHPEGYEYFRGVYHEALSAGGRVRRASELAAIGELENFTLLHQGDDPAHNTATALYEFLSALNPSCPPGEG